MTELCFFVGITEATLRTWYRWYEVRDVDCPELPMPVKIGRRKYWKRSDVDKVIAFKMWMPRGRNGLMGRQNEVHWSAYRKAKDGINR